MSGSSDILTGQAGLMETLDLRLPAPPVRSVVRPGVRRTVTHDGQTLERYPPSYLSESSTLERIDALVDDKRYCIYKNLAEWRDLNATRVLSEYRNGESFLYLGRCYRLTLVPDQEVPLQLKHGRFCLRRDLVGNDGSLDAAKAAFRPTTSSSARSASRTESRISHPRLESRLLASSLGNSGTAGPAVRQPARSPSTGSA